MQASLRCLFVLFFVVGFQVYPANGRQQTGSLVTHQEVSLLYTKDYQVQFVAYQTELIGDPKTKKTGKLFGYDEAGKREKREQDFIGARREIYFKIYHRGSGREVRGEIPYSIFRRAICNSPAIAVDSKDLIAKNGEFGINLAFGGINGEVPDFAQCYRMDIVIDGQPLSHYIDVYAAVSGIDIYKIPRKE